MASRNALRAYTINVMNWDEAKQYARPIREAVFVREQAVPADLEWDEWDELAMHAIALAPDGTPVGTGRLLILSGEEARIGRMAVLADWRRRGVGAGLLGILIELALCKGLVAVTLHAQTHALDFYRCYGFVEQGEAFMEAGIPHFTMRRSLARDPDRNGR
jgi:predicted GNAT family N-acyltransferase